ncbi:tetraspanin-32 isoform X5 [Bos indicus x Bos taurus]|nr:tetraspanin-32 isoform X5 [Bos indicus x Bos taurus]XP_027388262.1 tetraspanin-32 isoform X5 [Bos indicus x Bos taurus]
MEDAVLDAYDRAYERALRSASGSGRQELVAIQDTGPQPPSPGAQSLQMHPGGIPVSAPVQSRCSWGPSESKQTLGSASAAPGHPPAYPRERRSYGLDSHVTLVGGEELFPSTWWGSGKRRLDQTSTSIEADGGWGSRGQLQTLGRGWGVRVRAEGIEGGFGRAPWPPTPRLWGEGRTHCRLKQTGGSSVLRSVRTEAPPVSAVHGLLGSGDHFPSSHGPPSSHRRQEGSCSPLTLQAGLSAGPGD